MTFDPSVPRWVRCVYRVAEWMDYSVLSPLSSKLMFRYGFLDRQDADASNVRIDGRRACKRRALASQLAPRRLGLILIDVARGFMAR